jgi:UDP-GlcNAc:undecaprenyl-phosphate GlcNAc-1-phosphate transferase
MFWLLGAINALNLIDGMDGLATGVGIVLSLAVAVMAMLTGHSTEAFLSLALAGGLLGFLMYNSPPASIFLGDAGSMLIGLLLGALAIRGALKGPATVALAAPTAIWAIPIFDVLMAILRRKLTGRSIYETDRGHLHHSLMKRGFSGRKTVAFIGMLCSLTALGATVSVAMDSELMAFAATLSVFGMLIVTGFFGHRESLLLCQRVKHFAVSLIPLRGRPYPAAGQMRARLEGTRRWDELWDMLTAFAQRFDLSSVQLNVNSPAIGEGFHASWQRKHRPDESQLWQSDIPLIAGKITVGRLKIMGACADGSVCTWMGDLIAGLKPFECQMLELLSDATGAPDVSSQSHHADPDAKSDTPFPNLAIVQDLAD